MGSVAVSKNGEIIYQRSIGYADIGNKIRADENSTYGIGSVTSTFTAVMVLKAVEENKLRIDQTIDKFFPKIPNAGIITIKHLLSHQSGIHSFTSLSAKTKNRVLRNIFKSGSDFIPGNKSVYNNLNYMILTYILEKIYDKPYAELLTTYITFPLELNNTHLLGKEVPDDYCKSYRFFGDWQLNTKASVQKASGAGEIVSTPYDLVKFSDALFSGKLLAEESLVFMGTAIGDIGSGLLLMPYSDRTGYGYTGENDGFYAQFAHYPDSNISYALTSNGTNFNPNDIALTLLSAEYDQLYEIPVFKSYKVSSKDLDKYLGVYANLEYEVSLRIAKIDSTLIAQGKGLPKPFALVAIDKDQFTLDRYNMVFVFNPAEQILLLKNSDKQILYTKKYMDSYFYDIGLKYLDSANFTKAINYFTKAIMLNSGNTIYFYERGNAYYNLEDFEMAISDFEHCFKILPDEAEYPYLIGICYDKMNSTDSALVNYNQAIQIYSTDSKYYKVRADLYFKMEEYTKAINDYDQVLKIDPYNGVSFYQRGVCRYKLNDKAGACEDWNNAVTNSFEEASEYIQKICLKSNIK